MMKRCKRLPLLLAVIILTSLMAPNVQAGEMAYVNNGPDKTIYLRPDVTSQVQGTLYSGSHLVVLLWQGNWANVAVNNVVATQAIGWVDGAGLALVGAAVPSLAVVNNPDPRDRLNLRAQPHASAATLGKYYNGTAADPLGPETKGWIQVRIGSIQGYMEAKYLLYDAFGGAVPSAKPTLTVRNRSGSGLNLRLGQSASSQLLRFYPNGTRVTVMGFTPTWYHVETADGLTGFMLGSGLYPQLDFQLPDRTLSPVVTPRPTGASSGGIDGWSGPMGYHPVAAWPLGPGHATVSNPNPADRLNLRTQPRTGAPTQGKYYSGVQVDVYEAIPGGWSRVAVGGLEGYMQTKYLDFTASTASAMPVMTIDNPGAARNLHLRYGKSTASRSLGLYPNGTQVILMGFDDTWAHVIVDGRMGFMQHRFLK